MSKIIGITVGTQLPKPNFNQTDPTKGDYIKNKPDFVGLQSTVNNLSNLIGDTSVSEQIDEVVANLGTITIDVEDADSGIAPYTNSDLFGGKAPSEYLGVNDTAVNSSNSEKLGGKDPKYYIQPRNLLDNSDFTNPVNQRGQTSYTGGYGIDRWQNSNSTITLTDDGLKLTKTDTNNVSKFVGTILPENINANSVYTVAISVNGVVETFNSAFPKTNGESYVIDGDTINGEFGKAASCYVIRYVFNQSIEYMIEWAALYEGSYTAETLPPYVPKGYAVELAECMRYFERIGKSNSDYHASMLLAVGTGGEMRVLQGYKVPKRIANPTIMLNGKNTGETVSVRDSMTGRQCTGVFSLWNNTNDDRLNTLTVAGASTVGSVYEGYIDVIADL